MCQPFQVKMELDEKIGSFDWQSIAIPCVLYIWHRVGWQARWNLQSYRGQKVFCRKIPELGSKLCNTHMMTAIATHPTPNTAIPAGNMGYVVKPPSVDIVVIRKLHVKHTHPCPGQDILQLIHLCMELLHTLGLRSFCTLGLASAEVLNYLQKVAG